MKCDCPTCDGTGTVIGKYVLCERRDGGVVQSSDTIEELIPRWKSRGLSLRIETIDGQIIPVSDVDYRRASDLAHPPRKQKASTTS